LLHDTSLQEQRCFGGHQHGARYQEAFEAFECPSALDA